MRRVLLIFLLIGFLPSCQSPVSPSEKEVLEIAPIPFAAIEPGENGVTVQEMSDYSQRHFQRVKQNTVNHKLPHLEVLNSDDEMVDLTDLIDKPTFILSMDTDCGFGQVYARENFPMAMSRPSVDRSQFDVIFLVSTYRDQSFKSDDVLAFRKDMEAIYEMVCLISEEDAEKMNAMGVTTLLVDGDGVVKYFRSGASLNSDGEIQIFDYMLSIVGLHEYEVKQ